MTAKSNGERQDRDGSPADRSGLRDMGDEPDPLAGRKGAINELHGHQSGQRKVQTEERAREMTELRASGVMPVELAERYGITPQRVRTIVANYLKGNRAKAAAELRDLYEKRYEDLARPFLRDARGWVERYPDDHADPDLRGKVKQVHPPDLKAAEFVLRTTNELRRLQGLDKLVIEHEGSTPEERSARIVAETEAYLKGVEDAKAAEGDTEGLEAAAGHTEAPEGL